MAAGSPAGTTTKAKRSDLIPIHPELAHELKGQLAAVSPKPADRLFPQTVTDATRRKDFLRAGLAREVPVLDERGDQVMIGKGKHSRAKKRIVTEDEQGESSTSTPCVQRSAPTWPGPVLPRKWRSGSCVTPIIARRSSTTPHWISRIRLAQSKNFSDTPASHAPKLDLY